MAGAVASALGEVRVEDVVRPQVLGVEDGEVVVEDVGVRVVQPEPATPSLLRLSCAPAGAWSRRAFGAQPRMSTLAPDTWLLWSKARSRASSLSRPSSTSEQCEKCTWEMPFSVFQSFARGFEFAVRLSEPAVALRTEVGDSTESQPRCDHA